MERFAVLLLVAVAMCGCSHQYAPSRDASGCLAACPGASVVETNTTGEMCRCWSHQAGFQYTFKFPSTQEGLDYARNRWTRGIGTVFGCAQRGLGWETTPDGENIRCAIPAEPDPQTKASLTKASLSRNPNLWPRFVVRPAWVQWLVGKRAS